MSTTTITTSTLKGVVADHVAAVIWQPNVLGSDAYGWKVTF